jgi:hypothetical protein
LTQKCEFKDESGSVNVYYPDQILAFRFNNGRYFVSNTYNNDKVFLEYLIDGIADLYYLEDEIGDHFFIEKDSLPLTELLYNETIKVINGKQFLTETRGFVNQLKFYLQDSKEILPQIEAIAKPQHRELINLVEDYHNLVCKDKRCLIYDKGAPFLWLSLEPFFGIGKMQFSDKAHYIYGIYTNLQSSYEKAYFRTGLVHYEYDMPMSEDFVGGTISVGQIPLQVHYLIGNAWIKPRLGIGYDLMLITIKTEDAKYKPANLTPNLNLGVLIKISNFVELSMGSNVQRTPFLFKQSQISFDLGLKYNFRHKKH